jgi:hypothetical protein
MDVNLTPLANSVGYPSAATETRDGLDLGKRLARIYARALALASANGNPGSPPLGIVERQSAQAAGDAAHLPMDDSLRPSQDKQMPMADDNT